MATPKSALPRTTVALTERTQKALAMASDITGETKTDTINRAIQMYAYIMRIQSVGGQVTCRESPDGEPTALRFM